jgi:hypothetical protein
MNDDPLDPPREPEGFVRLPGLFHRWEIEPVLVAGSEFRVQPAGGDDAGKPVFAVHVRAIGAQRATPPPTYGRARRASQSQDSETDTLVHRFLGIGGEPGDSSRMDAPSLGELKARHREDHLCFRCTHQRVCRMAHAIEPALMVTVSGCLGFEAAQTEEACELTLIEPMPPQ